MFTERQEKGQKASRWTNSLLIVSTQSCSLDSRAQVSWRLKESSQEETTSRPTGDHTFTMITDATHTTLAGQHNRSLTDQQITSMGKSQCADLHLEPHRPHHHLKAPARTNDTHTGRASQGKSTKLDSCCLHGRKGGGGGREIKEARSIRQIKTR